MPPTLQKPQEFNQPTGGYFDLLPTPNPAELMFRLKFKANRFQATQMPAVGTALSGCSMLPVKGPIQLENYMTYVYLMCQRDGDFLWFYFGKSRTAAQRDEPFRTFFDNRNYPWPAVLEDVYFVKSPTFVQSVYNGTTTVTAPSYFPRYRYRPAVNVNSLVRIEQYLAETPWDAAKLKHEQPVPTDVQGSFVGVDVTFPRCLHGKVTFPELVPGAQVVTGVGMENPPIGRNPIKMVFPETNFVDWSEFTLEDTQQPVNGMWLREKITIFPPSQPETVFT